MGAGEGVGVGKMHEEDQNVQTSSYKINKPWGCAVQPVFTQVVVMVVSFITLSQFLKLSGLLASLFSRVQELAGELWVEE